MTFKSIIIISSTSKKGFWWRLYTSRWSWCRYSAFSINVTLFPPFLELIRSHQSHPQLAAVSWILCSSSFIQQISKIAVLYTVTFNHTTCFASYKATLTTKCFQIHCQQTQLIFRVLLFKNAANRSFSSSSVPRLKENGKKVKV